MGQIFPYAAPSAVVPMLMKERVGLGLTIACTMWPPWFLVQPVQCHPESPESLNISTALAQAPDPLPHQSGMQAAMARRREEVRLLERREGRWAMACYLERSPEVQHSYAKRTPPAPHPGVAVSISVKRQCRSKRCMRRAVPDIPVNGITEAKLEQGFLLAAEPAQQHWSPAFLVPAALASRGSQNQAPEEQPSRTNRLNSGWSHHPVMPMPTSRPDAAEGLCGGWGPQREEEEGGRRKEWLGLALAPGAAGYTLGRELGVSSSAQEQLQDILDPRSDFEQMNGAGVWPEVIRGTCLSHLPLPEVLLQASKPHLLVWLHHHAGAVSARSLGSSPTVTPLGLKLLWGRWEWESWRMYAFLFPGTKRVFNSNKTAISLIATVNLEVIYAISYFCKERILKNEITSV